MKSKRFVVILGILAAVVAFVARRVLAQKATGLASGQAREFRAAIEAAYASTLAAFGANGDSDPAALEERAKADAQALESAFEAVRPALSERLAPAVASFVESITAAQVQLMAFAINRKNRDPNDPAQAELERDDRTAFKRITEPLLAQLVSALS